jgi:hypothetical protein
MRDRRKGKRLDYRKAWRSCLGFSLNKHFDKLHPESQLPCYDYIRTNQIVDSYQNMFNGKITYYYRHIRVWITGRHPWQWWYNREQEWVASKIGRAAVAEGRGCGSMNSDFRRSHNKLDRHRQKQMLREAVRNDELEDFAMPPQKRYIRWLYW